MSLQHPISTDRKSAVLSSCHRPGLFLQIPLPSMNAAPDSRPSTSSKRKPARPSTAPAKDDSLLLPSFTSAKDTMDDRSISAGYMHNESPFIGEHLPETPPRQQPDNAFRRDIMTGNLNLGPLPPPYDFMLEQSSLMSHSQEKSMDMHFEYDWATFITAYALGRWDPHRTPNPPLTAQSNANHGGQILFSESLSAASFGSNSTQLTFAASPDQTDEINENNLSLSSINFPPLSNFQLPRTRNSFSTSSATTVASEMLGSQYSNTDVQTTVATMRWAAARVNISPLALPSPEHELTDPMRGITAAIPGSHPEDGDITRHDFPPTSCSTRKSRLGSFWEGTTDVDAGATGSAGQARLATILGSPPNNQLTEGAPTEHHDELQPDIGFPFDVPLPLTRTSTHTDSHTQHLAGNVPEKLSVSLTQQRFTHDGALSSEPSSVIAQPPPLSLSLPPTITSIPQPPNSGPELGTMSVPALPRRVCLTRQSSSPLPASLTQQARLTGGRAVSAGLASLKTGRAAKEEQMYVELGYLASPYPPDELERRRALYKFNIWHTGPDVNFDRIAHLVKLVFNTRGSYISLIDGHDQWFKSGWGTMADTCARMHSFCSHAILQREDEPMVILDTHADWRFAKNPLVIGAPHIRFYAGAPLRTQDGFNIGTLAIIDDSPWDDFSPRQRHTLKEFSAIVMREMELWRDKIQLRIRDRIQSSMEQFSRECLEIDLENQGQYKDGRPGLFAGPPMDKVYDNAAKLVKRTLDVEGVIVMDISHCEVLESLSAEGSVSVTMHHGELGTDMTKQQLSTEEYKTLIYFFNKHPDGKISEGIIPHSFRPFLPTHIQYALTVPIFNIDKRPFALICAYNVSDHSKRFLEGHELSYLRAIGVIILSAVLKRRMMLADKAKSLFISNISHELRTPLHGILAAAELLSDSSLNHSQASFLQTIQACGTSLVETVNHVLDFTKLSGNSKAGGVENVIIPSNVDLMQLVEEAVDGCWVGHRARTDIMSDSGIGSVYSPPKDHPGSPVTTRKRRVETVVDIEYRPEGWLLKCEKGGIRRILMNLFGNSLKFTSDGFVHVQLRQLPLTPEDPPDKVKVELSVIDTGKGISQNFLKNQLFHPFSQENPLQTGTGLGLAIVSSIVTSDSVNGKIDVRSEEGAGTEIRVTFLAEKPDVTEQLTQPLVFKNDDRTSSMPTIALVGFDNKEHHGIQLLRTALLIYLKSWWNFKTVSSTKSADIMIINEDSTLVKTATESHDTRQSFIILSAARGNPALMSIASEFERIGGFCRILYKPGGPSRLWIILKLAIHAIKIGSRSRCTSADGTMENGPSHSTSMSLMLDKTSAANAGLARRKSEDYKRRPHTFLRRPSIAPRSTTGHTGSVWSRASYFAEKSRPHEEIKSMSTVSIGTGGTLLKASIGSTEKSRRRYRILVVEDNNILRNLLIKWLSKKGYNYREAVDGRDGVTVFKSDGPFDVVLLDLSMPVLDGIAATAEIREFESRRERDAEIQRTRILALTGMSSLEDKRRAFEAGVDGYLVKPVAFKTLDEMFHQIGIS
ncbi:hypothetical protein AX17_007345 [Amanita inopinata Kibby_2008]|nr:hypothetical protein AX17_007345 [Amanita inopinata Kibby_2008]